MNFLTISLVQPTFRGAGNRMVSAPVFARNARASKIGKAQDSAHFGSTPHRYQITAKDRVTITTPQGLAIQYRVGNKLGLYGDETMFSLLNSGTDVGTITGVRDVSYSTYSLDHGDESAKTYDLAPSS